MLKQLTLGGVAAIWFTAPLHAQSVQDVRCVVLSGLYAQEMKEPKAKSVAMSASYYYAGKIEGRWSDANLRAEIQRQKKASTALAPAEMQACVKAMTGSLQRLTTLEKASSTKK